MPDAVLSSDDVDDDRGAGLALLALTASRRGRPTLSIWAILAFFIGLLATHWPFQPYSMLPGTETRGIIIVAALFVYGLIRTEKITDSLPLIAVGASALLIWCLLDAAGGTFIFSDDHSVVVYRLALLKDRFPFIPFYNPLWNAGLDARDFFATGILNLFILGAPLIYLFDVPSIYNYLIAGVLFALAPAASWYACRFEGYSRRTGAIAALLTITASLYWYRWGLKYGSMGFVTSATLVVLNVVIAKRLIFQESLPRRIVALFLATFSLMLCWSMSGVVFIPLIMIALFNIRTLIKLPRIRSVIVWLLVINIPWIMLFFSVSKVGQFLTLTKAATTASVPLRIESDSKTTGEGTQQSVTVSEKPAFNTRSIKGKRKPFSLDNALAYIRDKAVPTQIAILIFFIPGLLALSASMKIAFASIAVWLLFLGLVVSPMKPQLELDRMLLLLALIGTLPSAVFMDRLLDWAISRRRAVVVSVVFGSVLAAVAGTAAIIYNRSVEQYSKADEAVIGLAKDLKEHVGDGRGVFIGFVLHELSSGHLAPLMQLSGKPLVASSLFHNVWWYTNLIPKPYMERGSAGIEEYLDLMNASLVIAHEREWHQYLGNKPNQYTLISRQGNFSLYRRHQFPNSYFLEGEGALLRQTSSSITVVLSQPDAILKFNYFPFLKVSGTCAMSGHSLPGDITFIKLTGCPVGSPLTIEARTGFSRMVAP